MNDEGIFVDVDALYAEMKKAWPEVVGAMEKRGLPREESIEILFLWIVENGLHLKMDTSIGPSKLYLSQVKAYATGMLEEIAEWEAEENDGEQ